jgi:hypothetical protein
MKPRKSLGALAVATPLAVATVLAAAPQAGAAIADAAMNNPQVLDHGNTLSIMFSSTISSDAADDAAAQNVATGLGGNVVGGLVDYALRHSPQQISTCRVTATATDPDGAGGTASADVPAGVTENEIRIPDQVHGTKWGKGDVDHFNVQLNCAQDQRGNVSKAILDQDAAAS